MKKRILAIALAILMLLPVVPMSVSAAGEALVITDGERGKDYTYEGGVLTVRTATPITIKNADPAATTDHIVVKKDISANITLAGVNISTDSASPFMIEDDSTGDVTITLAENSVNTLVSFSKDYAGLQKNGYIDGIGKLTITGTGKLEAKSNNGDGAGIGGSNGKSTSNITISGGDVTADGLAFAGSGAGIGGGFGGSGSNITITGGTVTAKGGSNDSGGDGAGAGIGGGGGSSGFNITITGGSVTAIGGPDDSGNGYGGAGIGGGGCGSGSNITISGGIVKASGGRGAAGIGSCIANSASNITITGGTVTAIGGHGTDKRFPAAGIGGGGDDNQLPLKTTCTNIIISGGSVRAVAGYPYESSDPHHDIGGSAGAVTPTNGTSEVYLLTIPNPNKKGIIIDNKLYSPFNHSAIDGDTNLYAYVTGEPHDVVIGDTLYKYTFSNGTFTADEGTPFTGEANPQFDVSSTDTTKTLTFGTDYYYINKVLTAISDKGITVKNKKDIATADHNIVVHKDITANITLSGVNISTSNNSPFKIEDDSTGDVTVTLAANSANVLTTTKYGCAGLQKNGSGDGIGKLTITGKGSLAATGGYNGGAGIGGGNEKDSSNIIITDSTVTATGGVGGSGIGGGFDGEGSNITIVDGTVTATGDVGGAGIGGGNNGGGINITILDSTVTAKGGNNGAGIGGGNNGTGSNITISGSSVRAAKGKDAPNDIGGGSGKAAVTPKNAEEHDVYLMTIPNPSNAKVYIDNAEYTPSNHTAADSNDTNLYAYVMGAHHTVKVGTETICYHFTGTAMVKCTLKSEYSTDDFGNHWLDCTDENCYIQHDFAEHTFNQVVDPKFETGVEANCQHGTEYYKSCICGAKGNETFEGTVLDPTNHVGTLGDWQMTDGEHWKEYSECGCKENKGVHKDESPADHKCDDCGKVLSEHELNDHPEYKADCTHNGMIAHYSCMHCGKLFADENAENEITDSDIVVPATGHSYENGECVNCGARDPEISKVRAFFLDIFKLIVRIIRDFPVWIQTLPEAFIGLFR